MTLPRQPVTAPPVRRTAGHLALPHLVATMVRDYARNPVNMLFLVLVPTVFVVVAADTLADAATLIGVGSQAPVETASAGWAASFLAGLAMYFQVAVNRDADRRLALAGFPAAGLTIARLITGVAVALAVTAVSTLALAASADMPSPARAVIGTLVSALIYLGIGAVVAVVLPDPLNGSMALLFIWIIDVFFGPVMGGSQAVGWRLLPTHFTSLWAVDLPSGHAATPGDLGWSLTWLALSLAAAFLAVASAVRGPRRHDRRPRRTPRHALTDAVTRTGGLAHQFTLALRLGLRQLGRTPVLWLLLAAVPAVFILLAEGTTPHRMAAVTVTDAGRTTSALFDLADIHGGTMAPIAVASLAMLAGLFQATETRTGDQRLVVTGYRWPRLAAARTVAALITAAVAVAASLVTAAFVFDPRNWAAYILGNALLATAYVLLGALIGPYVGTLAGAFLAFLVPFLDVGLGQSPMLHASPPTWAELMPGNGASQVLLDGALTNGFDRWSGLVLAVGWVLVLLIATMLASPRPANPTAADRPGRRSPDYLTSIDPGTVSARC